MRDYKGHSSRAGTSAPTPRPLPPREAEDVPVPPSPRRRWPWLLILLILLLSGATWWWLAQLPLDRGQLGLLKSSSQKPTAAVTSGLSAAPAMPATSAASATPTASAAAAPAVSAPAAAAASATASASSHVDFNFYRILPQMKVDIPKDILGSGPGIPETAATRSAIALKPVIIQVGAFSNHGAARVLQERLALLGVTTRLHETQGADGQVLYSLVSNPFPSLVQAQPALTRIRGLGLTPVLSSAAADEHVQITPSPTSVPDSR